MVRSWILLLAAVALAGCAGNSGLADNIKTLAGTGEAGDADGSATVARFRNPVNVATDIFGMVYVCDFDNDRIRKVAANGTVSTLVNQPNFSRPFGIAMGPGFTLYVQTDANDLGERNATTGTVWAIDTSTGAATVVARNLGRPRGLAVLPNGDLVLSDIAHHVVSRLNVSTGVVTRIAGGLDQPGYKDAKGSAARFDRPYGVTVLGDGSILVADQNNNRIRKVTQSGDVTTFAGSGLAGSAGGSLAAASLNAPQDVKLAPNGTIFVADTGGHMIRAITSSGPSGGSVHVFAGTGVRGFYDGPRLQSEFWGLEGIAVSPAGEVIIADGTGGDDDNPPYNRVRIVRE